MSEVNEKFHNEEVALWLRRNPDFLQLYPDLALTLVIPRETGSTASLVNYQLEVLRDKNRELSRRMGELSANALENERLTVRVHQLTLALMRQATMADTLVAMAASLKEDFQGDLVRIVIFSPIPESLIGATWLKSIPANNALLEPFQDCLTDGEPLCGRLQTQKNTLLYAQHALDVGSSALLPMPGVGLVALGSHDSNRFYPGMGTLFLRMIGESLTAALKRFNTTY